MDIQVIKLTPKDIDKFAALIRVCYTTTKIKTWGAQKTTVFIISRFRQSLSRW